MSDLTFTQYDTAPSVYGTLTINDEIMEDLDTAAEIRFQMRKATSNLYVVDAVASVEDAEDGTVRYDWGDNDLSYTGEFIARWRVEHLDGTTQHSEPENTITVDPA